MAHLYEFFTQNPVGYAIGIVLALVAVVKKDWGSVFGHIILVAAGLMVVWSALNTFKDWRSVATVCCLSGAVVFSASLILWPSKQNIQKQATPPKQTRTTSTPPIIRFDAGVVIA